MQQPLKLSFYYVLRRNVIDKYFYQMASNKNSIFGAIPDPLLWGFIITDSKIYRFIHVQG